MTLWNNLRARTLLVSFFLVLAGGVYFFNVDAASNGKEVPSNSEAEKFWAEEIQKRGGELAYKSFSRIVAHENEPDKHLQAHFFGAALYEVEGAEGILVCDKKYGYACFHQFLGNAIADLGISSVKKLNEICFKDISSRPLACQHSIGHGILAYFGYERTNLSEALAVCRDLPYIDPGEGCYGGVFMEYNMRSVLGPDAPVREFTGNIADPCDSVDDEYKNKCLYWLPQWWRQSSLLDEPGEVVLRQVGEYCDSSATTDELLESCYKGIGLITLQVAMYDPPRVRELCFAASDDAGNRLACLSNAAHILGETINQEKAAHVCEEITPHMQEYCLAYARNEANSNRPIAIPTDL